MLTNHRKERTYFDSGDFALSAANRETDNGSIQTGRTHPYRDSISHPYAPIPAASNVDKDANKDSYRKSASPEKSPLLQQTDIETKSTIEEGQAKPIARESWDQIILLKFKLEKKRDEHANSQTGTMRQSLYCNVKANYGILLDLGIPVWVNHQGTNWDDWCVF